MNELVQNRDVRVSAAQLLNVWEWGLGQSPQHQALALLRLAYPATALEALLQFSIGERDSLLLKLRQAVFGSRLESVAVCAACQQNLELSLQITDLIVSTPSLRTSGPFVFNRAGYTIEYRLPTIQDFLDLGVVYESGLTNYDWLMERCISQAFYAGTAVTPPQLPSEVIAAIEEGMDQADPQANLQLALTCPACHHSWLASFDIVGFLWHELEVWAHRLLRDVHTIASAYGWREIDILALSSRRRQHYLAMILG